MLTASGPPPVPAGVTAASATFARNLPVVEREFRRDELQHQPRLGRQRPVHKSRHFRQPVLYRFWAGQWASPIIMWSRRSAAKAARAAIPVVIKRGRAKPLPIFGGFEVPNIGSGNYVYTPTGAFWSFSSAGLIANGSGFSNP